MEKKGVWIAAVAGAFVVGGAGGYLLRVATEPASGAEVVDRLKQVSKEALTKYVARSKTSEASMNVRKLYDSSVSYYEEEFATKDGKILVKQFPKSTDWTPPLGTCCKHPDGKCPGMSLAFSKNPTWNALNFSVDDPFYYSYRYISEGDGKSARFTAQASGDLNCNGKYSLFERTGTIDDQGNVQGDTRGLIKKDDLE